MRRFLIAGNWKMNGTPSEAANLLQDLVSKKKSILDEVDILVCPPFVSLWMASEYLHDTDIQVGAQNIYPEESGAYTGEISPDMLKECGCNYVIIGHSERREYFEESDAFINKKIRVALKNEISPILCVGESLEQRKADNHFNIVSEQLKKGLSGIDSASKVPFVIAYEPIWAIGTGETASPEQAQEMHAYIRSELVSLFDESSASETQILYGGSMKPANAEDLLQQKDVDGGLIGGASLEAGSFAEIITIAENISKK